MLHKPMTAHMHKTWKAMTTRTKFITIVMCVGMAVIFISKFITLA